jgi:two-component system, cell cycle sensor histidine kinase and response regulator CckA
MKADVIFQLENAPWPAFLVAPGGALEDINPAAQTFFGERLQTREFSALGEGETSSTSFISLCERLNSPLLPLKFRGRDGTVTTFLTTISSLTLSTQKYYLFQLFPKPGAATSSTGTSGDAKGGSIEINAVQKQKLDCAMQLTRTVALDFNNALTTILGHASYVLAQLEPNHKWRFSLGEIEKASEKASEIANDLAVFSLEDKDRRSQVEGNLNVLVRRAVQLFQTGDRKDVVWSQKFEKQVFTVHFDEAKLQQAFVKILENAVEAIATTSQVNGQISVQTRNVDVTDRVQDGSVQLARGAYVCVEITDDGKGIEESALPRIFEPFFSTKEGHRGLGLAWVYGIVSNHGGGVAVTSQPGQGTSVRVYLPAVKKIVEEKHLSDQNLSGEGTILFVDDEDMLVALGQMLLTSAGYKVLTANSAERALEVFEKTPDPIHLLITDMVMPKMNGRELIHRVRKSYPQTRIICSTACVRTATTVQHYNFLSKPFTAQELLRLVKSALAAAN